MEEELLSRQLPHSLEAEQAVLGSMLIDSRCVVEVIGMVRPDDFFLQQNRDIYETIYTMFNYAETIDPVTVLEKLKQRGVGDDKLASYLMQLMEITPTAANVMQYAGIVRDKALMRNLADNGVFTEEEYGKIRTILNKKYDFPSGSIFAEAA